MKKLSAISTAALLLIVTAIPGFAHHRVSAQFDSTRATTITGMITKVEWTNPHVWLYVTVDGSKLDVSDKWPAGKGPNNPR